MYLQSYFVHSNMFYCFFTIRIPAIYCFDYISVNSSLILLFTVFLTQLTFLLSQMLLNIFLVYTVSDFSPCVHRQFKHVDFEMEAWNFPIEMLGRPWRCEVKGQGWSHSRETQICESLSQLKPGISWALRRRVSGGRWMEGQGLGVRDGKQEEEEPS